MRLLNLAFNIEVMIPIDSSLPTMRIGCYDKLSNLGQLRANLDLLEDIRDKVHICMVSYWQQVAQYYNSSMRSKAF